MHNIVYSKRHIYIYIIPYPIYKVAYAIHHTNRYIAYAIYHIPYLRNPITMCNISCTWSSNKIQHIISNTWFGKCNISYTRRVHIGPPPHLYSRPALEWPAGRWAGGVGWLTGYSHMTNFCIFKVLRPRLPTPDALPPRSFKKKKKKKACWANMLFFFFFFF